MKTMKALLLMMVLLFSASTVLGADSKWMGYSFDWIDHTPNPRFAINDPGTPSDQTDDLVLDKMTGLIWMRNGSYLGAGISWQEAVSLCREVITVGNVKGWRLPTAEELSTLIDMVSTPPYVVHQGHPFYNLPGVYFWSRTTLETDSSFAWVVNFYDGQVFGHDKTVGTAFVLPVLGGSGYASGNW